MVRVPYICAQTSAVSRGNQLDPSVTLRISYQQHPVSNLVTSIREGARILVVSNVTPPIVILMMEVYLDEKVWPVLPRRPGSLDLVFCIHFLCLCVIC